jgi:protoheme IX farnesyltransferase
MVGGAAVTGDIGLFSLVLFGIIFLWTPPHFWALALYRRGDYDKAGVPMLPVVAGAVETKRQIMLYSLALGPLSLLPWALGIAGPVYAVGAGVLGLLFVAGALGVWRDVGDGAAKRLFGYSIVYLFLLFALLILDRVPGASA